MTREICNNVSKPIKVTPSDGTVTISFTFSMILGCTYLVRILHTSADNSFADLAFPFPLLLDDWFKIDTDCCPAIVECFDINDVQPISYHAVMHVHVFLGPGVLRYLG